MLGEFGPKAVAQSGPLWSKIGQVWPNVGRVLAEVGPARVNWWVAWRSTVRQILGKLLLSALIGLRTIAAITPLLDTLNPSGPSIKVDLSGPWAAEKLGFPFGAPGFSTAN